jgi:hypothetical protein
MIRQLTCCDKKAGQHAKNAVKEASKASRAASKAARSKALNDALALVAAGKVRPRRPHHKPTPTKPRPEHCHGCPQKTKTHAVR